MKRISAFISVLAVGICSYANVVDRNAANAVAEQFLASSASCVYEEKRAGTKSAAESSPAFYIFENSSGWVIVAGEDCAVPVLGYGNGHFPYDDMPANMRSFLEGLGQEILWAREKRLSADSGTAAKWKNVASLRSRTKAGGVTKGPLTAEITWTQSSPYNSKAPYDTGGEICPAGCGATAFAIIARYHEWPERGVGVIPAYTTSTERIPMEAINIEGYEYDWKNMPKDSKAVISDNQKDSIGTLMLHIGCGMKMDYESSGSATSIDRTQSFAVNHFSYRKSCVVLYRDEYSPDEWYSLMRHEIECDRPVFYAAQGTSSGHAMVLDGFDDNTGMISVNWGWGAGGKGWYVLNTMNGIKDSGWWDRGNTSALIGLEPDRSGDSQNFGRIQLSYGMTLDNTADNIKKIGKFDVRLNNLTRKDKTDATKAVDIKVMLLDRDSRVVEQVSEDVKHIEFTSGGAVVNSIDGGTVACEISGRYVIGDRIACFYSSTPGVWYPLGSTVERVNSSMGAYRLDVIVLPRNLKEGVVFYPQVLPGGWKTLKKVEWYYDRRAMDPKYPSVFLEAGEHSIKAKVTYSDDTVRWLYADFTVEQ